MTYELILEAEEKGLVVALARDTAVNGTQQQRWTDHDLQDLQL